MFAESFVFDSLKQLVKRSFGRNEEHTDLSNCQKAKTHSKNLARVEEFGAKQKKMTFFISAQRKVIEMNDDDDNKKHLDVGLKSVCFA